MQCKEGIVSELKSGSIVVLIERRSACSECHARGACTSSDKDERLLELSDFPPGLQVGDKVRILATKGGTPLKAVLFAFVIPLLLIVLVTIALSAAKVEELVLLGALVGLLLLYAFALWLLRGYFDKAFRLKAERA